MGFRVQTVRRDGWAHFLHLYAKVVEDCPLVMTATSAAASIEKVTVQFASQVKEILENEFWYKMSWIIADRNGLSGEIFAMNSFSIPPQGDEQATQPVA